MTQERIAELEDELRRRDEKIKELTSELAEARELVDAMRDHVRDERQARLEWVSVFQMHQDQAGTWEFDSKQSDLWTEHGDLWDKHSALLAKWNKFVGEYNSTVLSRDIGRPLAASEAQQRDVKKRHKAGESIRKIALATSLGMRTVRTIIEKAKGSTRGAKRDAKVRRQEFDRIRAAEYRQRKRSRDAMPKQIAGLEKTADALLKQAKGLGR